MERIAHWLSGPIYRPILVAAVFFVVPLTSSVGAAVVCFSALRRGLSSGAVVGSGALLLVALVAMLSDGAVIAAVTSTLVVVGSALGLAGLLRKSGSLNLVFQVLSLSALVLTVVAYGAGGVAAYLHENVRTLLMQMAVEAGRESGQAQTWAELLAERAVGLVLAGFVLWLVFTTVLARWAEGSLDTAVRIGREFKSLRTGAVVAAVGSVFLVASLLADWRWAENGSVVFAMVCLIQGMALLHWLAAQRGWNRGWLAAAYAALLVPTPLVAPAASAAVTMGYLDNWVNFRDWFERRSKPTGKGDK